MSEQPFTIAARATPPAAGGVGIIRLSGVNALVVARTLVPSLPDSPEPRHAYFASLCDLSGAVLDEGLVLFFRGPHSYTGEDVVELQAHGGVRLLELLLGELLKDDRVRLAEPGEFTRRAYLNGRMDLARAEAVADLVAAESEAAVRAASAQVRGLLSERLEEHRMRLLGLHADLEGTLNFPQEAEGADEHAGPRVLAELSTLRSLLSEAKQGRLIRRGARVVLFGPPNAGKSTLFNALLGEERALVDEEPGTTRDALEARVERRGISLTLVDTAGVRESPGRVEAKGVERTKAELSSADLAVLVLPPAEEGIGAWREHVPAETAIVVVRSKADLLKRPRLEDSSGALSSLGSKTPSGAQNSAVPEASSHPQSHTVSEALSVSAKTGEGVAALSDEIFGALFGAGAVNAVPLTAERHIDALRRAVGALERAAIAANVSTLEVVAGEVSLANEALGEITGENVSENLLDEIFRRFCIGK